MVELPAGRGSSLARATIFDDYFRIFPWYRLPPGGGVGLDIGCGKRALVDVDAAKEPHLSENRLPEYPLQLISSTSIPLRRTGILPFDRSPEH